ncbi:carboxypeptidase regulatory-like domain-containing protein [uncultured Paludibaculum sp.]|uniref:TonB-dependent receptor n=1 Tax=uncultured Paludibaculum sp. TaxID=1765020 RepID=UPI002AAC337B|nr:carboxypeptidase regulatory-like domain-containing protein [uncultured Paludibaculum sp.]
MKLLPAACLFLSCSYAGSLTGVIRARGHNVPLTEAYVTATAANVSRTGYSTAEGRYQIDNLPANTPALLTVELRGFVTATREITLNEAGGTADFDLSLADIRQSVVVADGLLSVRSDAPEKSQTVTGEQLRELPANGRRLMRFALLSPFVRPTIGTGADANDSNRLSINASSYRHTAYMIDGSVNYDWIYANGPQQTVSVGAVEQFKILSGQYAAEFGTSTAGVLTVVTRSGGSSHHGEAFGSLRPSGIQAQAPLAAAGLAHIPNERTQWGASAGGPLAGTRTNYFLNYEGSHQERGAYIQSPQPSFFVGNLNEHQALARIDHRWNERQWISWRSNIYVFSGNNVNDRVAGFNQPSYGRETRTQSLGSQVTLHSLLGSLFNELRVSVVGYTPDSAFPLQSSVQITRPNYSTEGFSTNNWVHSQTYDIGDVAAIRRGRHELKAGFSYMRQFVRDYSYTPFGTYTFAAGTPAANPEPLRFSQTFGTADFRYGQAVASGFVQDDQHLSPRLSLNLGLRYEYQSITKDKNNFAPRLGLAYDLKGDGKTMIRAGAGMFYDQFYLYIYRRFYSLSPFAPTATYTLTPGSPEFPVFPNSLAKPPTTGAAASRDLYIPASRLFNPYSLQYTLRLERRLGSNYLLSVDGLHTHVLRQMRVDDINHPAPFVRTQPGQIRTAAQADATRPYRAYLGVPARLIAVIENSSSSIYDSLSIGLARSGGKRFSGELRYALSSSSAYSMFFADANSGVPNEWNNWGSAERGPSDFHQRHRFVANGLIRLPREFQFAAIAIVAGGLPVNPLTGKDNNGDTYSVDRPVGFGRNSFRGPMQAQLDASLSRRFALTDHVNANFGIEVFNVFNRNNYFEVNNIYGESGAPLATFRQPIAGITRTDPSRQIQFMLRFSY